MILQNILIAGMPLRLYLQPDKRINDWLWKG